jgi:aquaporin Z
MAAFDRGVQPSVRARSPSDSGTADEQSWVRDFTDPSREWRRLFSELLGTFLLVLAAAGAGVTESATGIPISRAAAVTAPGLMVMAVILFMGKVGGAHLNPVVSLAFALRAEFPWRKCPATSSRRLQEACSHVFSCGPPLAGPAR